MMYDDEEKPVGEEYDFVTTISGRVSHVNDTRHPDDIRDVVGILVIPHEQAKPKKKIIGEDGEEEEEDAEEEEEQEPRPKADPEEEEEEDMSVEVPEGEERPQKKKYKVHVALFWSVFFYCTL